MEQLLNSLWFWTSLLYVGAAAVFIPFVKIITRKPLVQCIFYSVLVQAVALLGYIGVFFATVAVIWHPPVPPEMRPLQALFPALFVFSLITVPALSSLTAKLILRIRSAGDIEVILGGNLSIFAILWLCVWLAPF